MSSYMTSRVRVRARLPEPDLTREECEASLITPAAGDVAGSGPTAAASETRERLGVVVVAQTELEKMGFTVERADGPDRSGIWATDALSAVALVIDDGGSLQIDIAGSTGDACWPLISRLVERMGRGGVEISGMVHVHHGSPGGGSLVARCGGRVERLVADEAVGVSRVPRMPLRQAGMVRW